MGRAFRLRRPSVEAQRSRSAWRSRLVWALSCAVFAVLVLPGAGVGAPATTGWYGDLKIKAEKFSPVGTVTQTVTWHFDGKLSDPSQEDADGGVWHQQALFVATEEGKSGDATCVRTTTGELRDATAFTITLNQDGTYRVAADKAPSMTIHVTQEGVPGCTDPFDDIDAVCASTPGGDRTPTADSPTATDLDGLDDQAAGNTLGCSSAFTSVTTSWDLSRTPSQTTIAITKIVDPTSDPGTFNLALDHKAVKMGVHSGETTGPIEVVPVVHNVGELAFAGSPLDSYTTDISCADQSANNQVISHAEGLTDHNDREIPVDVPAGHQVLCTVTNRVASITVNEVSNPSNDPGRFHLQVDGVTKAAGVGPTGTTGTVPVSAAGTHSVGELVTPGTGTSFENYTTTIVCLDASAANQQIGTIVGTLLLGLTVPVGHHVVCTITNTHKGAKVTVNYAPTSSGTGTFVSAPSRIDCPAVTCSAFFELGTQVTVTATPQTGSGFSLWTGGPCAGTAKAHQRTCTFTITQDTTLEGEFLQTGHCAANAHGAHTTATYTGSFPHLQLFRFNVGANYCYDGRVGEFRNSGAYEYGVVLTGLRVNVLTILSHVLPTGAVDLDYDLQSESRPQITSNRVVFQGGQFTLNYHWKAALIGVGIGELLAPIFEPASEQIAAYLKVTKDTPALKRHFVEVVVDIALGDAQDLIVEDLIDHPLDALRPALPDVLVDQMESVLEQELDQAIAALRARMTALIEHGSYNPLAVDPTSLLLNYLSKNVSGPVQFWRPVVTMTVTPQGVLSVTETGEHYPFPFTVKRTG
jgi:hypothetical protein